MRKLLAQFRRADSPGAVPNASTMMTAIVECDSKAAFMNMGIAAPGCNLQRPDSAATCRRIHPARKRPAYLVSGRRSSNSVCGAA